MRSTLWAFSRFEISTRLFPRITPSTAKEEFRPVAEAL